MDHNNYTKTDKGNEIKSPTEGLNNTESSDHIPSSPAEAPNKPVSSEQEIPSSVELLSTTELEALNNPESSGHISSPAEAPNKPESSEQESPSSVEVLSTPELEVLNIPESSDHIHSSAEAPKKPESSNIPSSAEVLNRPELELLNNPDLSDHIPSAAEAPNKPESSELKIPSSADVLSTPESAANKMSSPAEASNKPDSTEKKAVSPAEASNTRKKTPKSLKGKAKIVKKSLIDNSLKGSKATSSSLVNAKRRRFRNKGPKESSNKSEDVKKVSSRKDKQQKNTDEQQTDKSHQAEKNKGKVDEVEKSQQKNTEKRRGPDKSVKSEMNGKKRDEKREKLGGLIFMCSGKTKPDCFHYRIMGVSVGKKDTVLGIKPGLKLFLYDFDLKLLYGVYKASSSGGLKLEPKAFGGAFPAQVRFNVEKDCLPLHERVFRKAIKENYDEKNKFKTELTVRQVRKLTALFRPAQVHLSSLPTRSPLRADNRDRETRGREREVLPLSHRDAHARDPYPNGNARSYPALAHEREQHARREEIPRDLYLSEKEYRAYGLQGERRNLAPRPVSPAVEVQHRDYERDHFVRQPNLYREAASVHRETVPSDPLYLNEKEYPAYTVGARHELPPATAAAAVDLYARDPYYSNYSYYGASSLDQYTAPHRREEVPLGSYLAGARRESYLVENDPMQRRAPDHVERSLYSAHAAAAIDDRLERSSYSGRAAGDDRLERSLYSARAAGDDRLERSLYSARAATAGDDRLGRSLYSARAATALDAVAPYQVTKPEALRTPVSSRYAFAGASYSYR
ncbi:hypothetical protein ABKV19_022141 [Rosa sericea]